ncbi:acetyl-CoA carboxylase carboxyl transferase subunit alpha [Enterococcus sp. LJL98]
MIKTPCEIVQAARSLAKGSAYEFIDHIFEDFVEFHGDRYAGDDKAIVGGIAYLKDIPVTVIGIQKGKSLEENIQARFGSPSPEGYRKALRLMRQGEKFNRPIITLINTPGAFCGVEAEQRGEGEAIAKNLLAMSHLKVPIIAIITGEGGSGGALALALADEVWMLEYSIYSILSPEGFASILWKDSKRSEEAAEIMKLTPADLKKSKVIDKIIKETDENELFSMQETGQRISTDLLKNLKKLQRQNVNELIENRYLKYRVF